VKRVGGKAGLSVGAGEGEDSADHGNDPNMVRTIKGFSLFCGIGERSRRGEKIFIAPCKNAEVWTKSRDGSSVSYEQAGRVARYRVGTQLYDG